MSKYEELGAEIGALVDEKQKAYGDSFGRAGEILRVLYPDGIPPDRYTDALAVTRLVDKLFRIATSKDALGEDPYRDIAGYGLLGARRAVKASQGPSQGKSRVRWKCGECGHAAWTWHGDMLPECCTAPDWVRDAEVSF